MDVHKMIILGNCFSPNKGEVSVSSILTERVIFITSSPPLPSSIKTYWRHLPRTEKEQLA